MKTNTNKSVDCHLALQIPEIMEHIFGFCSIRDLTSFRQVSKCWELASRGQWRASAQVKIDVCNIRQFKNYVTERKQESYYKNFAVYGAHLNILSQPFWRLCGSHIKVLTLDHGYFPDIQSFRKVIFDWTPNMTALTLNRILVLQVPMDGKEPEQWEDNKFGENWNLKKLNIVQNCSILTIGISCLELLSHFPGLNTLIVEADNDRLDVVFKAVGIIRRRDPRKLKLQQICQRFKGSGTIGPGLLDVLTDRTLEIQSISVGANGNNVEESLARIFRANGNSLRKLELERREPGFYLAWLDPLAIFNQLQINFANLSEIVLRSRVFRSLQFLKFTPKLTKLSITIDGQENNGIIRETNPTDMLNVRLENCKEFSFNKFVSVNDLQNLTTWLPNVERLALPLYSDTFTFVCQTWTGLTSFSIPASGVNECAFTGLDKEYVNAINDGNGTCLLEYPTVTSANITWLKDLQTLVMVAPPYMQKLSLRFAAVKFGIGEVPRLRQLSINGYELEESIWNGLHDKYKLLPE